MSQTELRELDAWIGVNVFGKKEISQGDPPPNRGTEDDYFVKQFIHFSRSLPHYSTDPAGAIAVLEKCARKVDQISITQCLDMWGVCEGNGNNEAPVSEGTAKTLPLAICLFAKSLFGGGE